MALKYVLNGVETYRTGKESHTLHDNHYLLTNEQNLCEVKIDHVVQSIGVCVDLDRNYLKDIVYTLVQVNEIDNPEKVLDFFFTEELLQTSKYASPALSANLKSVFQLSQNTENDVLMGDLLSDLSLSLVRDQIKLIGRYYRIDTIKPSTRRENFRRVQKVRSILHDQASHSMVYLPEIAREVCLSEFRMLHLFKQVYGCTPYQYFLFCKIQRALFIRKTERKMWTEIAFDLGFSDLASFSKLFKKVTGESPAYYSESTAYCH
jgi:AraC family transcriptional regulator